MGIVCLAHQTRGKQRGIRKAIKPILIIRQFIVENLWIPIGLMRNGDMGKFIPFLISEGSHVKVREPTSDVDGKYKAIIGGDLL